MLAVLTVDGDVLPWTQYKRDCVRHRLRFRSFTILRRKPRPPPKINITEWEYQRHLARSVRSQQHSSDLRALRTEWQNVRAELSWLTASLLSAVAVAAAVFVGSRSRWSSETALLAAFLAGVAVFAAEVVLYIIFATE